MMRGHRFAGWILKIRAYVQHDSPAGRRRGQLLEIKRRSAGLARDALHHRAVNHEQVRDRGVSGRLAHGGAAFFARHQRGQGERLLRAIGDDDFVGRDHRAARVQTFGNRLAQLGQSGGTGIFVKPARIVREHFAAQPLQQSFGNGVGIGHAA